MTSTREEWPRHYRLVGAIGLPLGFLFLVIALNRPSIANMRFHDIFFLLATGICLGSGLAGLIIYFVGRRQG